MARIQSHSRRLRRKRRVRSHIFGTAERPRFSAFRSLRSFSMQVIDDTLGKTLVSVSLREISGATNTVSGAEQVGKLLAEKCLKSGISQGLFDRNGYRYHGKVKAAADGLRAGGVRI